MGDLLKQILAMAIQSTDQLIKAAAEASIFKQDCAELKVRAEKLAEELRKAARASSDLYERLAIRIINDTHNVLDKAFNLVVNCRGHGIVKRVFTIISAAAIRKMSDQIQDSIQDVSWLLRLANGDDGGLPPIAVSEPMLHIIWQQIALVYKGSPDVRAAAAKSLVALARDGERNVNLIIEEGGVGPLLKLVKEGKLEGQLNAAKAIGLLGKDAESVEQMIREGVGLVFAKILKDGPMKVQAEVAWAVAELVDHYPQCQDHFEQQNIIRFLIRHLSFETVQEHSKYAVVSKANSIHAAVVLASSKMNNENVSNMIDLEDEKILTSHPLGTHHHSSQMHEVVASKMAMENAHNHGKVSPLHHHSPSYFHSQSHVSSKAREMEDPATKDHMKAMTAKALWKLAKGNPSICQSITESRALLCFAFLMENGTEEVQYNSAMALIEITAVAEENHELRKAAFKPNSLACKAVVDQMVTVIEKADSHLLIPCIRSIGNLSKIFKSTETRMITPLVNLLDQSVEEDISKESCIALTKFSREDNYLHVEHSKAILAAGGAKHLVQHVWFSGHILQSSALILLSQIAFHVPDNEQLRKAEVHKVLEWASKQATLMQVEETEKLVMEAKAKMDVYQFTGIRGYPLNLK